MDASQTMLISTVEKTDSYVVDLEGLDFDRELPENSRITLQRSFTRKGTQKQPNSSNTSMNMNMNMNMNRDREGGQGSNVGAVRQEKPMRLTTGTTDHAVISAQMQHQITLTAAGIETTSSPVNTAGRFLKRSVSRRSRPSWALDPRKVLLFFATLSSMGTILLIYFTLSVG